MSTRGFSGNTSAWNDAREGEMERDTELPKRECNLGQPCWENCLAISIRTKHT